MINVETDQVDANGESESMVCGSTVQPIRRARMLNTSEFGYLIVNWSGNELSEQAEGLVTGEWLAMSFIFYYNNEDTTTDITVLINDNTETTFSIVSPPFNQKSGTEMKLFEGITGFVLDVNMSNKPIHKSEIQELRLNNPYDFTLVACPLG